MNQENAVILLSGGLDSATALAVARADGCRLFALSFRYGQRHSHELTAAEAVAAHFEVERHLVLDIDLKAIGGSALTDDIAVPRDRIAGTQKNDIPVTYVPARNTVFLSLALAWAETLGARFIYIGVNALDYSGYPDCRPEFIEAFEATANLATRAGVQGKPFRIRAPLIDLSKAEIIRLGNTLGVPWKLTHSCYDPDARGRACGHCDSCLLRKRGFREAGIPDPTPYATSH